MLSSPKGTWNNGTCVKDFGQMSRSILLYCAITAHATTHQLHERAGDRDDGDAANDVCGERGYKAEEVEPGNEAHGDQETEEHEGGGACARVRMCVCIGWIDPRSRREQTDFSCSCMYLTLHKFNPLSAPA